MGKNIDIVNGFLGAYWAADEARLKEFTHPEIVWDNVSFHRYELVDGAFKRTDIALHGMEGLGSSDRIEMDAGSGRHETLSETEQGDVVYQERYDRLRIKGVDVEMQCVGVFHVKDGQVILWRDYFDLDHWVSQLSQLGIEWAPPWAQQ